MADVTRTYHVETDASHRERLAGYHPPRANTVCGAVVDGEFSKRPEDEGSLAVFNFGHVRDALRMDPRPKGLAEVCGECKTRMEQSAKAAETDA